MKPMNLKEMTLAELDDLNLQIVKEYKRRSMDQEKKEIHEKMGNRHIRVRIWNDGQCEEGHPMFSFFLVSENDSSERCIYYDTEEDEREEVMELIPTGFGEEMENTYSFCGTMEMAIETLTQCGFTDIINDLKNENSE